MTPLSKALWLIGPFVFMAWIISSAMPEQSYVRPPQASAAERAAQAACPRDWATVPEACRPR